VALAQCESFFRQHPKIRRLPAEDTAGSVRHVVQSRDTTRAAIGQHSCSASIWRHRAGRASRGQSRELHTIPSAQFCAKICSAHSQRKQALSRAAVGAQPGSLWHALGVFAQRKINLLRIESRPVAGRPWEYMFYLDLAASLADESTQDALRELQQHASTVRTLGCLCGGGNAGRWVRTEVAQKSSGPAQGRAAKFDGLASLSRTLPTAHRNAISRRAAQP